MRSTFYGLEIARTGLSVSQKGLDVTGHNISNVDTAGYTRQRLVNTAYEPFAAVTKFRYPDNALVGSGATVKILDQIRSSFLDRQYRSEQSILSYWQTRTQGLSYIESLYEGKEDSDLGAGIKDLFEAFNALTKEGNDKEQRTLLKDKGAILAENFNLIYDRLIEQQKNQNLSVETMVGQINDIADNIALLNKSIYAYELIAGQPANDLRDKRNLLIDELSTLVDIEYETDSDGKFIVRTGGEELVNHVTTKKLLFAPEANEVTGETDISVPYWDDGTGNPGSALVLSSGQLKSAVDLRDSTSSEQPGVPYFVEQLNNLVRALVEQINTVHAEGYTHPTSGAVQQGMLFFHVPAGGIGEITAGNIRMNQAILDNVYNIAASSSPDPLQEGNQENARKLFELYKAQGITLTVGAQPAIAIGSFSSFLSGMVLEVAVTLNHSKKMTSTQSVRVLDADNQRTSISGVSLDEEMTNLIKYQHAYAGASRVITTMDEALDMLINRMGLVGRS